MAEDSVAAEDFTASCLLPCLFLSCVVLSCPCDCLVVGGFLAEDSVVVGNFVVVGDSCVEDTDVVDEDRK